MGRWADVTRLQTLSKAFNLSELTLQNKTITSSLCYWTIRGKKRGGTFVSVVSNTAQNQPSNQKPGILLTLVGVMGELLGNRAAQMAGML